MSSYTLSRRSFVSASMVAAAGLSMGATCARAEEATPSQAIDPTSIERTSEADAIVVGAGLAGLCTAVSAVEQGLSVIVIEKNEQGRAQGLDFGCINSALAQEEYGIEQYGDEDIYRLTRRWVAESSGQTRPDHILSFLTNCGSAMNWVVEKMEAWGCTPIIAAYSSNSDTYENVRGIIEFHNGPAWDMATGSFGARDVSDALADELNKAGMPIAFKTAARQLVQSEGGTVTGVICEDNDGLIRYTAKKGVVLATGDFAGNPEMLATYSAWNFASYPAESVANYSTGTGDGHRMGLAVGAQMRKNQPLMLLPFTYPYFYLRVNKNGKRFMNEDCGSTGMSVGQLSQPEGIAWSIWDAKWPSELPASLEFGGGMDWDQDFRVMGTEWSEATEQQTMDNNIASGRLFVCDTIEEPAGKTGLPIDAFVSTIERYNQIASDGHDPDFGKRPELLTSISEPPFYALRMTTGLCVSVSGLEVDVEHAVLNADGLPIAGLYAVGNVATDLHTSGDYVETIVPGNSLGRCVTYGKMLGEHLAK